MLSLPPYRRKGNTAAVAVGRNRSKISAKGGRSATNRGPRHSLWLAFRRTPRGADNWTIDEEEAAQLPVLPLRIL